MATAKISKGAGGPKPERMNAKVWSARGTRMEWNGDIVGGLTQAFFYIGSAAARDALIVKLQAINEELTSAENAGFQALPPIEVRNVILSPEVPT